MKEQEIQPYLLMLKNELNVRNYSQKTLKAYTSCIISYLQTISRSQLLLFATNQVKQFLLYKRETGISANTLNLYLCALKFFYSRIVQPPQTVNVKSAKRSHHIPIVLAKKEIALLLNAIKNRKHRLMIATAYSAGLRVSELVALKVRDIWFEDKVIHIREGKGKRDRITLLSDTLFRPLKQIILNKQGSDYIFESERGGKLTTATAQKIFRRALFSTKITKNATFHSLRHSFATHLIEDGVDIRYIQELLGHHNIRTTQMYTQVTSAKLHNIKSPL